LTLVENGVTHNMPNDDGKLFFDLHYQEQPQFRSYTLKVTGKNRTEGQKQGTGMKYVYSRLDESFGDDWSIDSGPVVDGWETVIKITK
ncbi:MAG: regulator, partial [Bacteroidota bacterium]